MPAALIKFTQGATTAAAGRALIGDLSGSVVASNGDNTGVTSWAWYLVSAPETSTLAASISEIDSSLNPIGPPISTSSTYTFTPDVSGTYQVLLLVNGHTMAPGDLTGLFDARDFIVEEASGYAIPAMRSDAETFNYAGQTRGWDTMVARILRRTFNLTFADITGSWSLSQIDNTGAPFTFLRSDGAWIGVVEDFSDLTGALSFAQRPPGGSSTTYFRGDGTWATLFGLPAPNDGDIAFGVTSGFSTSWSALSAPPAAGYVLNSGNGGIPAWTSAPTIASTLTLSALGAGFVRTSSGGVVSSSALVAGDIPNISATYLTVSTASSTYATKAALTGTGYFKGAGSFPPSFVTTIARADLANASGAVGDLWYWDGSNMVRLAAVASGSLLASAGVATAPAYSASPTITGLTLSGATASTYATFNGSKALTSQSGVPLVDLGNSGGAQGDVLYWSGSAWTKLGAGTTGQALLTSGASANPAWDTDFQAQDLKTTGKIYERTTPGSAKNESRNYVVNAESTTSSVFTLESFTPVVSSVTDVIVTVVGIKSNETVQIKQDAESCMRTDSSGTVTEMGTNTTSTAKTNGTTTGFVLAIDTSGGAIRVRVTPPSAGGTFEWTGNVTVIQRSITA